MKSRPKLKPSQRALLAQFLRKKAREKNPLTPEQRQEARRRASNLEALNRAKKKDAAQP